MLLNVLLNSFFDAGDQIGYYGVWFFIILFGAMFIYAMIKYAKK